MNAKHILNQFNVQEAITKNLQIPIKDIEMFQWYLRNNRLVSITMNDTEVSISTKSDIIDNNIEPLIDILKTVEGDKHFNPLNVLIKKGFSTNTKLNTFKKRCNTILNRQNFKKNKGKVLIAFDTENNIWLNINLNDVTGMNL